MPATNECEFPSVCIRVHPWFLFSAPGSLALTSPMLFCFGESKPRMDTDSHGWGEAAVKLRQPASQILFAWFAVNLRYLSRRHPVEHVLQHLRASREEQKVVLAGIIF